MVRCVRPWKAPWNAMMPGRRVACLASFTAFSTASAPEFANMTWSMSSGRISMSLSASSSIGWCRYTPICACATLVAWSCTAATILGWQWPVFSTAMPITKSSHLLPSVSVTQLPTAVSAVMGASGPTK